jgi:hypothetical protein
VCRQPTAIESPESREHTQSQFQRGKAGFAIRPNGQGGQSLPIQTAENAERMDASPCSENSLRAEYFLARILVPNLTAYQRTRISR